MKNITWDMAEQFTFPVGLGAIEDVVSVKVTPKWEQSDDGQSIRLSGIYHIVASIQFNPVQQVEQVDGTYIEHIDLEHSTGYFEYALPLEVDLPSNKVEGPIKLEVSDIKTSNDTASCQFVWQVQCDFSGTQTAALNEEGVTKVQVQPKPEKPPVVQQDTVKEEVAQQETVEHKQVEEVAQLETEENKLKQEVAQLKEELQQQIAQQETAEQEVIHEQVALQEEEQEHVAQHELIEQEPKREKVKSQVAQRIVAQRENVQHEPVATQESSFKQPAAQNTPLNDDFFFDLTDSYSVYNAKLNNIRS